MSPKPGRTTNGPAPTGIRSTTRAGDGSMRVTVFAVRFGIQSSPSGPSQPSVGPPPTVRRATTLFVAMLILASLPSPGETAQTAPCETASHVGPLSLVSMRRNLFVLGLMRKTVVPAPEPTQTEPPATRNPPGVRPVWMRFTTLPLFGSMRLTWPLPKSDDQTEPAAQATSYGAAATLIRLTPFSAPGSTWSPRFVP